MDHGQTRKHTDFIGAKRVLDEIKNGASRKRVGVRITGKGVAREGAEVFDESGEKQIGVLTSGGFSPTLKQAIGQAYIETTQPQIPEQKLISESVAATSKPKLPTCLL